MIDTLMRIDRSFIQELFQKKDRLKQVFCLGVIGRQKYLLYLFDREYGQTLYQFFERSLTKGFEMVLNGLGKQDELNNLIEEIIDKTPHSEEFGSFEGGFAQNALISAAYFFRFSQAFLNQEFAWAIGKVIESIDLINYEKNNNYDKTEVFSKEIGVYKSLLDIIEYRDINRLLVDDVKEWSLANSIKP